MKHFFAFLAKFYRLAVSPIMPPACRFDPTCSDYAEQAFRKHGVFWGMLMSGWRILRCNPFCKAGEDPVPLSSDEWLERWFKRDVKKVKET